MNEKANNGKSKLISVLFRVIGWLVGVLFTIVVLVSIPALANNMIKNDRLREQGDKELHGRINNVQEGINEKLDKIIQKQSEQGERLARIEAKVDK